MLVECDTVGLREHDGWSEGCQWDGVRGRGVQSGENHQLRPLYRDPVVEMFLDEDTRHAAKLIADSFPPVKDMVRIRTKYLDDTLDRHIASGFRQVVILGAGLDTRAVRKQAAGVTYFEI